jgi:hypothetical protein
MDFGPTHEIDLTSSVARASLSGVVRTGRMIVRARA